MSYHVYVSKEGFKDNPIPMDQWLAAARQCNELVVQEQANRQRPNYRITLKANKRSRFERTPYGLIHVQAPSREQVIVMFKLANLLGANVYSEYLDRYMSVEDWEEKTREYRQDRDERRYAYRVRRRKHLVLFILFLLACVLAGYMA